LCGCALPRIVEPQFSATRLTVSPSGPLINWQLDVHNNHQARLLFPEKTNELVVEVDLVAELSPINPFDFFWSLESKTTHSSTLAELANDLAPYLFVEAAGPRLQDFLEKVSREKRGTIGFLVDLNRRVRNEIDYVTRLDPGIQTCEQTLEKRSGSCRDSAWLLVQILRHLGIAARFVSGYLIQLAAEDKGAGGGSGPQNDSADYHAWSEAFLPGAGWIGMDPTSGLFAGEGHIPLVCTPNPSKAAPIEGTVEPAEVDFRFSMAVRRLENADAGRPSQPITDEDWLRRWNRWRIASTRT
jgi:transglutaminase-like putative cysteine protease